jgi:hypothetical protein
MSEENKEKVQKIYDQMRGVIIDHEPLDVASALTTVLLQFLVSNIECNQKRRDCFEELVREIREMRIHLETFIGTQP